MHAGGTAAYLAHRGEVVALSGDDTFDDAPMPLLARALGTTPTLDVAVSSVMLDEGDVIILCGRRVPGEIDRRALIAHVEAADPQEHLLVARFEHDDASETGPEAVAAWRPLHVAASLARIAAAIGFVLTMVFAR
jgi:hypothetical protein